MAKPEKITREEKKKGGRLTKLYAGAKREVSKNEDKCGGAVNSAALV